jgi:hypothetical protein
MPVESAGPNSNFGFGLNPSVRATVIRARAMRREK